MLSTLLEQIQIWIEAIIRATGYLGITLLMIAENLFPPIPSELVLPFSGFLVEEGTLSFVAVVLAATLGALIGALLIYGIGTRMSEAGVRRWVLRYGKWLLLTEADLDRSLTVFRSRGNWILFLGRFIPTVRSLISLPAGLERMPLAPFLLYSAAGTLLWNLLLIGSGVWLGQNWQEILNWVDRYEQVFYVLLVVWVVWRLWQRFATRTAAEQI